MIFDLGLKMKHQIRWRIWLFIAALTISGVTAWPIETQLNIAHRWISCPGDDVFSKWIDNVYHGVTETNAEYPFISYGSDWLGFAHIVIAIVFVGPLRDPVRNRWVIEFGLIACMLIFPFSFVAGHVREIPIFWRLIDCTFGLVGGWLLWSCYKKINELEKIKLAYEKYIENSWCDQRF